MPDQDRVAPAGEGPAPAPAILLVYDNAAKRLAMRAMLAPLGHALVEADSGRAALRAVLRQTFAIILMDVRMPTLAGSGCAPEPVGGVLPAVGPVEPGGVGVDPADGLRR